MFHTYTSKIILVFACAAFFMPTGGLKAQCDVEVSGILAYCNSFRNTSNNTFPGYFIGFRIKSETGDTLDVVDLAGNNPTNRGKRIDNIVNQQEPSDTSRARVRIAGGIDSLEYWYFGPFTDGDSFNIVLVDVNGECDTVEVASGTFTCAGADPNACDSKVPLYFLDFSQSEWNIGGGGSSNEDFDEVFLIMQRSRVETCCHTGSDRCFEFIITLDEDDIGLLIDDVGSGSPGGSIFADSLSGFACGTSQANTWPYYQDNGQSSDLPLCLNAVAREWIVLSCKEGGNVTGVSFGTVGEINVLPGYVYSDCTVDLQVFNVSSALWTSPDDPDLSNLINFTTDSLHVTFSYDEELYGPVTSCDGDTFTYYVAGNPDNACLAIDSLYSDTTFVVVYPGFSIVIDSVCTGSNDSVFLQANLSSGALLCDYSFLWSTGDTTATIKVPNISGEYSISVTREDIDSLVRDCTPAFDIIQVEPTGVVCLPDHQFACPFESPPADTNTIQVSGCGINPKIYTYDVSNNGSGCILDSLIIDRYYIIDFDGDTINTLLDKDTCIQTIVIVDNMPPDIVCPADVSLECLADTDPLFTGFATGTDNCGPADIAYHDVITNGICPQEYVITRIWRATDDCGNSSSCQQIINVTDNTPPAITCPANITMSCEEATEPLVTGFATAIDICDTSAAITYTDVISPGGCPRTLTRTWTATDDCGNFNTCIQIISLLDTIAPEIICPSDITLNCSESTDPSNSGAANGSDNCDVSLTISHSDVQENGTCPQNLSIARTWTITDDCGNATTCIQMITTIDTIPPVLNCPPDITIQCHESTLPSLTGHAGATDNCDIALLATFTDTILNGSCPNEKSIHRTWNVADDCGNTSTCTQIISIVDEIAPVITCPSDVTIGCTSSTLPDNTGTASATDNCDPVTPEYSDVVLEGSCPQEFFITRTWTVLDQCENLSSCVQLITVRDEVPPVITCPANITIDFMESTLPANTGNATAVDDCDPTPEVTYSDVLPANCPEINTIIRTFVATDTCGNSSSCQQMIVISDHGSICGNVSDDFGDVVPGVEIQLWADVNNDEAIDGGDTLVSSTITAATGDYCFTDIKPCNYVIVEVQPANYTDLFDYDFTPDPDGNDSLQGPDNQIPVFLQQGEPDTNNNFVDVICFFNIPAIPPDTICSGDSVVFQFAPMDPGALMYSWDFGSGSDTASAMGLGPHTVAYVTTTENQVNGVIVSLTIHKEGCPDFTRQVSSVDINAYPDATIDASTSNMCYYTNRAFQALGPPIPNATYLWDFGIGAVPATATGYGPHTVYYTIPDTVEVKLVIHPNEAGAQCSDSSSIIFRILNCPGNITGSVRSNTGLGIPGVNLRLYFDQDQNGEEDNLMFVRNVFTTSNGSYSMVGLTPGSYVIVQTQPTSWTSLDDEDTTNDNDPVPNIDSLDNLIPATVLPSEIDASNIFTEIPLPGSIGGSVFIDDNGNEAPDTGEGLQGVTLNLFEDDNKDGQADSPTPYATAVTTSTGVYNFSGIPVGNYVIIEEQPSGFDNRKDYDASNDQDSVANASTTDDILPVTLTNLEFDEHNYFIDQHECTLLVINTDDDGLGSLRYMIGCAVANDTIRFDTSLLGDTILITSEKIVIESDVVIYAEGSPRITIKSDIPGLFDIAQNHDVSFFDINIVSGISGGGGAAFYNFGILRLSNVTIVRNTLLESFEYLIQNAFGSELIIEGDNSLFSD